MTLTPIRRAIWRTRHAIAQTVMPRGAVEQSNGPHSMPEADSLEVRVEARGLWESGHVNEALDLLRRKILDDPWDSLLWMSYGYRLQSLERFSGAYECFTNSVEIDPGNFGALEHFLEMASTRNETQRIESVLSRLPSAIVDRPHRHLESLYFSIPYGISDAVDIAATGGVAVAESVIALQRRGQIAGQLSDSDSRVAVAVFNLCDDNRAGSLKALAKLESHQIPLTGLRLTIRKAIAEADAKNAIALLGEYLRASPGDIWAQRQLERMRRDTHLDAPKSDLDLLKKGFPFPKQQSVPLFAMERAQVVYALHNSLPYHSAGYSTRSHGLISAIRDQGWQVDGVSRLGYPTDLQGFRNLQFAPAVDYVDRVPYHRLGIQSGYASRKPTISYVESYAEELAAFARDRKAFLVHAASNHLNGLAAVSAARMLGLPSIYEVRGLWEVTRASRDPIWSASVEYRLAAELEAEAASTASHVIAITQALKSELVSRGIEADKISVVPNGVDTSRFKPVARDQSLARALDIGDKIVIGYVGSIVDYEGLGLLTQAVALLSEDRNDFVVLIVGDGAEYEGLKTQVRNLNIDHLFRFAGRVPHDQVERYYSLVDIAPFPRLAVPVCEMVSPLKPLEAMAMGKVVIASDVAAMVEIVNDGITGILHRKNDVVALTESLRTVMNDRNLRLRLSEHARSWVEEERQWDALGARVGRIYESLGGQTS